MMSESASVSGSEHVHERLSEFLNGDLSDPERQAIEVHLRGCEECRRDFESLRLTVQLVRQVPLQRVPRSFTIPVPDRRRSRQMVWLRWSTGVLAATLVALLALRFILPEPLQPATPAIESAASGAVRPFAAAVPTSAPAALPQPTAVSNQPDGSASESGQPAAAAPTEALRPLAAAAQPQPMGPTITPGPTGDTASGAARSATEPSTGSRTLTTPVEPGQTAVASTAGQKAPTASSPTPTSRPVAGLRPLSHSASTTQHGVLPDWYT